MTRSWLWGLLPLVACGAEEPPAASLRVDFAPCSFMTGGTDDTAECARVRVPLTWDQPEGDTLELFVKRRRGDAGSHGQLWLLAGGPGVDGSFFEPIVDRFAAARPDLDLVLLDHRGTGRSSRLECPDQEAPGSPGGASITSGELAGCLDHLESHRASALAHLNPTEAARDLAELVEALDDGGELFVYGRSYGTYLLHRYLQLAPDQADGVVFDSICGPRECRFPVFYDLGHDQAGRALLGRCASDSTCSSYLIDPESALDALYADLGHGHCPALGWGRGDLRGLLSNMVRDQTARQLIPAVIHRLQRCSGGDVAALEHLADTASSATPSVSWLLRSHIVHSELWRDATLAEEQTIEDGLFVGGALATLVHEHEVWPRYLPDAYAGTLADTDIPVVMMHGGLDPQTPLSVTTSLRERFVGPHQSWVEVPRSSHGVIDASPMSDGRTCGEIVLGLFLSAPQTLPNTDCAALAAPIDFSADATRYFGRADAWN